MIGWLEVVGVPNKVAGENVNLRPCIIIFVYFILLFCTLFFILLSCVLYVVKPCWLYCIVL